MQNDKKKQNKYKLKHTEFFFFKYYSIIYHFNSFLIKTNKYTLKNHTLIEVIF